MSEQEPWTSARNAAARLAEATGVKSIDMAVVLGSGWRPAAERIGSTLGEVSTSALGGFPSVGVTGHEPTVRVVEADGCRIAVFLGRIHGYEGHSPAVVVHGVRAAVFAGARVVVLTNAAGALNSAYAVGQPVVISDHLNLTGQSPLSGPLPPSDVPIRFADLTNLYDDALRAVAREVDPTLAEGTYASVHGPNYETPAEVRMLRALGADLVGMSTALEAIAARHLGARVFGLSLVTNAAAGDIPGAPLEHAAVVAAGDAAADTVGDLLARLVRRFP